MSTPAPKHPWPPELGAEFDNPAPPEIVVVSDPPDGSALRAFKTEQKLLRTRTLAGRQGVIAVTIVGLGLLVIAGGVAAGIIYFRTRQTPTSASNVAALAVAEGTITISSRPEGAQVTIDGVARGVTPLKLSLPAGEHALELQNGTASRGLPLVIEAGTIMSQYVDLAPAAVASTGRLEVLSDPPGAQVNVDGRPRGVTPLVIAAITPGSHRVVVSDGDGSVTRTVNVSAGATSSVLASVTPVGAAAGWVTFGKLPLDLQVSEGGQLIGTTSMERVMLPAGRHVLELTNQALEFRTTATVQVAAGKTATAAVTVPNGTISINALPWAEVSVDGQAVGATPLGNLSLPIGTHEVVWRHPQLGERRQTVVVKAQSRVRVTVDFSK